MVSSIFCFLVLTSPFWLSSSALDWKMEPGFVTRQLSSYTWSNNDSMTDTIKYEDGSLARLILGREGNDSVPGFGCGFICSTGNCTSYFLAVVILGGRNTSANDQQVWLANRDHPITENGTLDFTSDGDLVLQDSDGTKVWFTDTSGKNITGIRLDNNGNLQLYSNTTTYWGSFERPTDALLPTQKLFKGGSLIASASAKNWSSGLYSAEMTSNGFAAFVQADDRQVMYLQKTIPRPVLGCSSGPCRRDNLSRDDSSAPTTYAVIFGKNLRLAVGKDSHSFPLVRDSESGSYHYLRLGFDGHLRIYQWRRNDVPSEVCDLVAQLLDECQYPHVCGDYGVCSTEGNCTCPKALDGFDYFKQSGGKSPNLVCSEIIPLSCQSPLDRHRMVDFGNLSYFNFIDSHAAVPKLKDLQGCKQACLNNCSCKAAFFKYNDSYTSDGDCYLPSKVLSIRANRRHGDAYSNSSAFIKVQLPYLAPSPQSGKIQKKHLTEIILSVVVITVLILFALCSVILMKKKKRKKKEETENEGEEYFNQVITTPKRFSYEELHAATKGFKDKLGGGGFGSVFEGVLEDGTRIAVKRLENRGQGMKEFLAEVETIGNVHHINLVRLIGFCAERSCQLLVYEYMSNGSLDHWIFNAQKNLDIDWQTRKKIILDIAKGLAYLHEECRQRIVHLDIKPQNILLDEHFNAKVSDFGLSKLMDRDQSQVQTTMRGTPGYLAPEWQQLRITLKVDIYSFGIVVLEIICGRKNLDRTLSEPNKHLLRLLQEKAEVSRLTDIVEGLSMDTQLHGDEVLKLIKLAAWCLQDDHTRRPPMSVVVKVLEGAMEVESNISYKFCNAMANSPTVVADSQPLQASVLSAPR